METIKGERHTITATFGFGHIDWNIREFFLGYLADSISADFGGCRFTEGTGIWREDGNGEPPHKGEIFEEDTVSLHVTVQDDPTHAVYMIREACRYARHATSGDVPIEWVNVEVTQSQAHHFKM
jgi:hypothetical protein